MSSISLRSCGSDTKSRRRPKTSGEPSLLSMIQTSSLKRDPGLTIDSSSSTLGGSSFLHNNANSRRPSTSPMVGTSKSDAAMDEVLNNFNRLPWGRRNIAVGKSIKRRGCRDSTHRISPSICSSPLSINLKNATSSLIGEKDRTKVESMIPPLRPGEFPVRSPQDFVVKSVL